MAKTKKRPMLVAIGDSTFEKIQAFYINPESYPLSEKHEQIRQRWVFVVALLLKTYSKIKIANTLVQDFGISQAQAFVDIRNAENMFGSIFKTEQEAFKAIWLEWTKDFLKRAKQSKDLNAEAKALKLLAEYGDLGDDNPEFNPEKLLNKEIRIVLPKAMHQKLLETISTGVVDFNNLDVTDINHEEVEE
jgi:chloramphenicol O-acetyltransferase